VVKAKADAKTGLSTTTRSLAHTRIMGPRKALALANYVVREKDIHWDASSFGISGKSNTMVEYMVRENSCLLSQILQHNSTILFLLLNATQCFYL